MARAKTEVFSSTGPLGILVVSEPVTPGKTLVVSEGAQKRIVVIAKLDVSEWSRKVPEIEYGNDGWPVLRTAKVLTPKTKLDIRVDEIVTELSEFAKEFSCNLKLERVFEGLETLRKHDSVTTKELEKQVRELTLERDELESEFDLQTARIDELEEQVEELQSRVPDGEEEGEKNIRLAEG